ncbi:MAG: hypothetical protein ACREB7_17510 [Sphingopyxis sp.]|uniref:hypothetical protein n=1 Tax=Sphingopyxis sp. TaxID=1908224 RepID=UPI003D6CDEE3
MLTGVGLQKTGSRDNLARPPTRQKTEENRQEYSDEAPYDGALQDRSSVNHPEGEKAENQTKKTTEGNGCAYDHAASARPFLERFLFHPPI